MKHRRERGICLLLLAGIFFLVAAGAVQPPSTQARSSPAVEIYTTSWCTACRQAVAYLRTKGVPFTEYDVEKDSDAARRWRSIAPNGGVPVAVIGDQVVRGFSREAYDRALERRR